ncbi:MAG: methyltransferase domain-containing protein [Deltaproteobacteria bacterium]|nr:methyltransferase domain-containing protein [Deltaproteobacteria bacterium]
MSEAGPREAIPAVHQDRARAESFGNVASEYERLRPPYAAALLDELASLKAPQALDVGCGTGKVAAALKERGQAILGVEPDARMAAVARAQGLEVELGTFESWDDAGRQFALVTCGNAWHWVNPTLGFAKLATVLSSGGTFGMFFAVDVLDADVAARLADVYRAHAPGLEVFGDPKLHREVDPFAGVELFESVEKCIFPVERTLSVDDCVGLMATVSNHQRLEADRLTALQRAAREALNELGPAVRARCSTHAWLARRKR